MDKAHFGEVLHPRRHSGQQIHQLHYTQLAFMFLRLRKEKEKDEEEVGEKIVSRLNGRGRKKAHLPLLYNVVLAELKTFIWRIKTNRPLIHIIINHSEVVHRAKGHTNSLQKLAAALSRNTPFVQLIMLCFPYYSNKHKNCCPRTTLY